MIDTITTHDDGVISPAAYQGETPRQFKALDFTARAREVLKNDNVEEFFKFLEAETAGPEVMAVLNDFRQVLQER